jgi:hypothetical protein
MGRDWGQSGVRYPSPVASEIKILSISGCSTVTVRKEVNDG